MWFFWGGIQCPTYLSVPPPPFFFNTHQKKKGGGGGGEGSVGALRYAEEKGQEDSLLWVMVFDWGDDVGDE